MTASQPDSVPQRPRFDPLTLLSLLLSSILAYFFYRGVRMLRNVLSQPLFEPRRLESVGDDLDKLEAQALQIARGNLLVGVERRRLLNGALKRVLPAGARNFREPWARDFGFATYGLLALEHYELVREGLEVFFHYQQPSGRFPVKVYSTGLLKRYLHSAFRREQPAVEPLRPRYVTAHGSRSLDSNLLITIAALNYIRHTGDETFGREHWPAIKQAVLWLKQREAGHLLYQRPFADWADSIARGGRVLYTNVLYWKAVHELAALAGRFDTPAEAEAWARKAAQIKEALQAHFWRREMGYFVTSERFTNLSSGGNLLAVAWGLADETQAERILDKMEALGMARPVPTRVTSFPYPRHFISLQNHLARIPHYHTDAAWLWLGAWHVIALARCGRLAAAEELLARMSEVIVRDGVVHEVYGPNGRHLSTRWYTSEAPLTWNAAMFIYAYDFLHPLSVEEGEKAAVATRAEE